MINITVNGITYQLPMEQLSTLLSWLQSNGAVKVLENISNNNQTLINE